MIYNGPMETKLHILTITLKDLMFKSLPTIVKKKESHLMLDLLYTHHSPMKGKQK